MLSGVVTSSPRFGTGFYYAIPAALGAFLLFLNWGSNAFKSNSKLVRCVFLYVFIIFFYKVVGISSAEWGIYMQQTFFCLSIIVMLFISLKIPKNIVKWCWWLMMIVFMYNVIDNIRLSILYPNIHLIVYEFEAEFFRSINAGGSGFYNIILFFFIVSFFVFLNSKQKWTKYIMLGCSIISAVYLCVYTLKAAIVIYSLLSIILLLYAKKAKNQSRLIGLCIVTGLIVVLFIHYFADSVIQYIIEISPNSRLSGRLVALVNSDDEEADARSISARSGLWLISIQTWLSNPINFLFGIGDHRAAFGAAKTGISQHSEFLDSLARYGLMGGYLLYILLKRSFEYILSLFDQRYRLQLMVIFFICILQGFTKGVLQPGIGVILFMILPLAAKFVNRESE